MPKDIPIILRATWIKQIISSTNFSWSSSIVVIFTEVKPIGDRAEYILNQVDDVARDWRSVEEGLDGLIDELPEPSRIFIIILLNFIQSKSLEPGKGLSVGLEMDSLNLSVFGWHEQDHASENA